MDDTWQYISTAPLDIPIMTKIDDEKHGPRNECVLVGQCREPGKTRTMWFTPDMAMYVYYQPTHWRLT